MEKLDSKSIMIGDWVSVKSYAKPNFYKISKLDPNMESSVYPIHVERPAEGLSYTFLDKDEIEPILLTTEILEKIGFKKKMDGTFELIYNEKGAYIEINYNPISGHLNTNWQWFIANHIYYVHELQHALKMSKVDKEIEL